jgi:DNA-binding FadR family transcriptional regulator
MPEDRTPSTPLDRLKAFIAEGHYQLNSRLPPERELCTRLDMNRSALRKALDVMEADGLIWRHVGRGTFIGTGPVDGANGVPHIISRTNPLEVMEARVRIEPELASLAALHANAADIEQMRLCLRKSRGAREWRIYEVWDNNLHQTISEATHNAVLISLYQTLSTVRRATVWGRSRKKKPTPDAAHHSHAEHAAIVEAIADRHMDEAAAHMRRHLESVRKGLMESYANVG